jgi:hypothetical protein
MMELSDSGAEIFEQSAADATTRLTKANKHALDFMTGAQKVMLEEMVFAASTIWVSGVTVMAGRVMIWWARMGASAGSRIIPFLKGYASRSGAI